MLNSKLKTLDAALIAEESKLASLKELITARSEVRAAIVSDIAAAQAAHDALTPSLETLLAREAVGEKVTAELSDLRAAVASAAKRVTTARKREGEAADLLMAENGLARRLDPIHAELSKLRTEREQVRNEIIMAAATAKMDAYAVTAATLASQFADVCVMADHLAGKLGRDPGIMAPQSLRIALPGFVGQPEHLMTEGGFGALKADSARRLHAELAAIGVQ